MSMWKPFSEAGRRSIVEAQQVAQRFASQGISQEHIFVGIAEAGASPATQALASFGISDKRVDEAAGRIMKRGKGGTREMVLTGDAKRVIERAFDEARHLRHKYIGPEHLLLAYLSEHGQKSEMLHELQVDPDALYAKVLELVPAAEPEQTLDHTFDSLGGHELASGEAKELWGSLSRAVTEKDIGAVLAYGLFIARRSGWNAAKTAEEIVSAAKRSR